MGGIGDQQSERSGGWLAGDSRDGLRPAATVAGVREFLAGGELHRAADREVGRLLIGASPSVVTGARAELGFVRRAVEFLAAGQVRQFVQLGCGYPATPDVHEVVLAANPDAVVVYVDSDASVVAQVAAGLARPGNGAVRDRVLSVQGSAGEAGELLTHPQVRGLLDAAVPTALVLVGVLEHLPHKEALRAVEMFRGMLPLGSALVLSHASASPAAAVPGAVEALEEAAAIHRLHVGPYTLRSRAELEEIVAGFTLLRPGLTRADRWRPAAIRPVMGASFGTAPEGAGVRPGVEVGGAVPLLAAVGVLGDPDLVGVPDVLGVHRRGG